MILLGGMVCQLPKVPLSAQGPTSLCSSPQQGSTPKDGTGSPSGSTGPPSGGTASSPEDRSTEARSGHDRDRVVLTLDVEMPVNEDRIMGKVGLLLLLSGLGVQVSASGDFRRGEEFSPVWAMRPGESAHVRECQREGRGTWGRERGGS